MTEFNQWLRGVDSKGLALWKEASAEVRHHEIVHQRTYGFFGLLGALPALVALAGFVAEATLTWNALVGLGAVGTLLVFAGLGALRRTGQSVAEGTNQRLLLEHKLGFLHGQLEGRNVAPRHSDAARVQALLAGRSTGRPRAGVAIWALLLLNLWLIAVGAWLRA